MKRKIVVTTGTRAEYGILRPLLYEISSSKKLELFLIVTGMHLSNKHGMTINEIKKDGFKIYQTLDMIPKDGSNYSMARTLGEGVSKFSNVFKKIQPDFNVVFGDRDESLASALAASHMNIPNAHIHGGDRSKAGIDEYNRHAITKISNVHFPATIKSKERIIKMGENPKFVFLTGSPSIDEIYSNKITSMKVLEIVYGSGFYDSGIVLLQHPVTTESNKSKTQILNTLNAIVKTKKSTIAIAPNSDAGNEEIFYYLKLYSKKYNFIKLYSNVPRSDYLGLLQNCGVLVGNSSSGIIEASYFNTPVVNIGLRQEGREHGKNVVNVKNDSSNNIYKAIMKALHNRHLIKKSTEYIYGKGNSSKKIVKHLENIILNDELIQKQIFY